MSKQEKWAIEDHLCVSCGGRILRALHGVVTGGGNPLFRCADCGKAAAAMSPAPLCWCGFSYKGQHHLKVYRCVPFSILNQEPDLRQAFLACGSDPDRKTAEVGVISEDAHRRYLSAKE